MEGCKGQKLGHACNVEEKVGEAQRAERSTARNSECVDCFRSFRFQFSQHSPTTRPSVERTAEEAFLLPDRV